MTLIIFDDMVKLSIYLENLEHNKLFLTRYPRHGLKGKQLVIEDLVYSGVKGRKSIGQVYKIAINYSDKLVFKDKKYVLLVNGASEYDMGLSLYVLNYILNNIREPEILVLTRAPPRNSNELIKASFYAWFKTISLYDIIFNYRVNGSFKYLLLNPDTSPRLIRYLIMLTDKIMHNIHSLLHIKLKRFLLPIAELYVLAELLKYRGEYSKIAGEYKYLLMLMHGVLDNAPTDLWSIARKKRHVIEGSRFIIKKLIEKKDVLEKSIYSILEVLERGRRYTSSMIDPKALLEKLLHGTPISRIYPEINISGRIELLRNISSNDLIDTYDLGVVDLVRNTYRYLVITPDLENYVNGDNVLVLDKGVGEISVVEFDETPLHVDCRVNTDYLPFDFYEAYLDRSGIALSQLYPPETRIQNKILKPYDIHRVNLVNYHGYIEYRDEKCSTYIKSFLKQLFS